MNANGVRRAVLRYHGGKWRLAPWVIQHLPPHRVYVEPYGGAASVLLRKERSYAEVYNDLAGEIVNVFRVLRNPSQARELERLLKLTPFAREEFEDAYLPAGDPVEAARRSIIRSFMGFGSGGVNGQRPTGFRNNAHRSGTTPAHDWRNYAEVIPAYCERLAGVVIENRPAVDLITQMDCSAETLFYVDPPYPHSTRTSGNVQHVYHHEMTDDEHRDLAEVLRKVQGMVVLSGYDCDLYRELYGDWQMVTKAAYADGARPRTEVMWLSANAVRQPELFAVGA